MSDAEWDPTMPHPASDTVQDPSPAPEPAPSVEAAPQYATLTAWMDDWFLQVVRRRVGRGSVSWCAQWWAHPEAASRLGALWAAWEESRTTGGAALSQWWLWHFDAHWPVLTNPAGPFSACTPERHVADPSPLPSAPVPAHVTEAAIT
jgi:hypothetical protein